VIATLKLWGLAGGLLGEARGPFTRRQLVGHRIQRDTRGRQQDQPVIQQVGALAGDLIGPWATAAITVSTASSPSFLAASEGSASSLAV